LKISCGTDIIHISRITNAWQKHGDRFLRRIFTPSELDDCLIDGTVTSAAAASLDARFAAKEAIAKALGTGIGSRCGWQDLTIRRDHFGAPAAVLANAALQRFRELGGTDLAISLTHDQDLAQAFCVMICSGHSACDEVHS